MHALIHARDVPPLGSGCPTRQSALSETGGAFELAVVSGLSKMYRIVGVICYFDRGMTLQLLAGS